MEKIILYFLPWLKGGDFEKKIENSFYFLMLFAVEVEIMIEAKLFCI